jgi:hypothetical protein
MGASTYVQCYGRGIWVVVTISQHTIRYCDRANIGIIGEVHERRTEGSNYCRIYLQAFFISDITNLEGKKIEEWAGHGQKQLGRQST